MRRIEKLIKEIRRQLFPYHHEHDIERKGERWEVEEGEYVSSWLADQLRNCRKRNRCEKRGRCVFYSYSDLSKRNYEICYEILLRLENGGFRCIIEESSEEK